MNLTNKITLAIDCQQISDTESQLTFTLTNGTHLTLQNFRLCATVSRTPKGLDGAKIVKSVGHYIEFTAEGKELKLDDKWSFTFTSAKLTHICQAAQGAYLVQGNDEDESILPVKMLPPTFKFIDKKLTCNQEQLEVIKDIQSIDVELVPYPTKVELKESTGVNLKQGFQFSAKSIQALQALHSAKATLVNIFCENSPLVLTHHGSCVVFNDSLDLQNESYILEIDTNTITITASSESGFFYGLMTLAQLAMGTKIYPSLRIEDSPRFEWRVQHLDVARQFYTLSEIKKLIDLMSFYKLNKFHWHLTDDEAWRLQSNTYPELTEKGAYRYHGGVIPPIWSVNPSPTGGFYTADCAREIVKYAQSRQIEVIPEIACIGHSYAVLQILNDLLEQEDQSKYISVQGYFPNILNPGLPQTYTFLENILSEVASIFPSQYIHIGVDECPDGRWEGSPACQALMQRENLKTIDDLQAYFIKRIQEILRKLGKKTGCWEEGTECGDIAKDSYTTSWTGTGAGLSAAKRGYSTVMSPAQHIYFDMVQNKHPWDPGASWAGVSTLQNSYSYDPVPEGTEGGENIMGVQGCLWGEYLGRKDRVYFMLVPRICALSEIAWTPNLSKDYQRFQTILEVSHLPQLKQAGIRHRPISNKHLHQFL